MHKEKNETVMVNVSVIKFEVERAGLGKAMLFSGS